MDKQLLRDLYLKRNLSMMDIAQQLHTTHAKVYYWFKKHKIKRRSWSDSAYTKQNPSGDPFRIRKNLRDEEKRLLIGGLMLYAGEGHRANKHSVQLANLDHRLLKLFTEFLRKICGVNENKISLYVQLHRKFDRSEAEKYWSRSLAIPRAQIKIYPHTDKRSKLDKQISKFGIARVQAHNYKLKNWIDEQLENYLREFKN